MTDWISAGSRSVSCHLALQLKCKDKRMMSTRVAKLLTDISESGTESSVLFCIFSLDYLLPQADVLKQLCGVLASRCIELDRPDGLVRMMNSRGPQSDIVHEMTISKFVQVVSVEKLRNLNFFVNHLSFMRRSGGFRRHYHVVCDEFVSKISYLQSKSSYITKMVYDLTGEAEWSAVVKHGPKVWSLVGGDPSLVMVQLDDILRSILRCKSESDFDANNDVKFAFLSLGGIHSASPSIKNNVKFPSLGFITKPILIPRDLEVSVAKLAVNVIMVATEFHTSRVISIGSSRIARIFNKLCKLIKKNDPEYNLSEKWLDGDYSIFSRRSGISRRNYLEYISGIRSVD